MAINRPAIIAAAVTAGIIGLAVYISIYLDTGNVSEDDCNVPVRGIVEAPDGVEGVERVVINEVTEFN